MFENKTEETMPVEVVDTMVASIVLSQGGEVVVKKSARDRVNNEGLVYSFRVNDEGDGVLTVVTKAERDAEAQALLNDQGAFVRELFKTLGMTDAEIDAIIAAEKGL